MTDRDLYVGRKVYVVTGTGRIFPIKWGGTDKQKARAATLGVYDTKEEAEEALIYIKRLCQRLASSSS